MSLQRATFRGDCSPVTFRETLSAFKQEGCNLLVTGPVPEEVTETATRTLLGAPEADRKRIVALANAGGREVGRRLPVGVESSRPDVWVVDQRSHRRSVPESAAGDAALPSDDGRDSDGSRLRGSAPGAENGDDLGRLREEILAAVEHFDGDDLDPAELRLSVSSLDWLAHEHDPDALARFVRSVAAMVRGVRGMAHYHLPRSDDDALVERLSPLFDARIELRQRDGLPTEQRWHVPEHGQTTDWVRL